VLYDDGVFSKQIITVQFIVNLINYFSKFDEDTHLAIALSVTNSGARKSDGDLQTENQAVLQTGRVDFRQNAFAAIMSSKTLGEVATTGAKRSKKNLL
jgi:hypothetical protein